MNRLKDIDHVSYVRFASVYKEFRDVDSFLEAIKELKNNR
jgi:transcriptional repressor NrdR